MRDEPIETLNGVALSIGQAMTLRVALESFAMSLQTEGLGDDESGRGLTKGYLDCIAQLRAIVYTGRP